ncbi:DgyrCDS5649 [Dimorphilus gyrociliatus]|uniref:DgyrCDS5649 n=1 Tax=Dimorphilus gyrociliatus TaxID=2664684 RepID=A0A7I8VKJ2_9ANNE|nr:DgyrCDS5649 [Dimorphilus gyrociliatus]
MDENKITDFLTSMRASIEKKEARKNVLKAELESLTKTEDTVRSICESTRKTLENTEFSLSFSLHRERELEERSEKCNKDIALLEQKFRESQSILNNLQHKKEKERQTMNEAVKERTTVIDDLRMGSVFREPQEELKKLKRIVKNRKQNLGKLKQLKTELQKEVAYEESELKSIQEKIADGRQTICKEKKLISELQQRIKVENEELNNS